MKKSGFGELITLVAVFLFALCIAMPYTASAADKLVVMDSAGTNTMYTVKDSGALTLGTANTNLNGGLTNFFGMTIFNPLQDGRSALEFGSNQSGTNSTVGAFAVYNTAIGVTDKRIGQIQFATDGAINSGKLILTSWNNGVAGFVAVFKANGSLGVGQANPTQKLEVNGGVRLNTVTAQPTCDSTARGTFWAVQGAAGVKDSVQVCAKDAGDAYAWRTVY